MVRHPVTSPAPGRPSARGPGQRARAGAQGEQRGEQREHRDHCEHRGRPGEQQHAGERRSGQGRGLVDAEQDGLDTVGPRSGSSAGGGSGGLGRDVAELGEHAGRRREHHRCRARHGAGGVEVQQHRAGGENQRPPQGGQVEDHRGATPVDDRSGPPEGSQARDPLQGEGGTRQHGGASSGQDEQRDAVGGHRERQRVRRARQVDAAHQPGRVACVPGCDRCPHAARSSSALATWGLPTSHWIRDVRAQASSASASTLMGRTSARGPGRSAFPG